MDHSQKPVLSLPCKMTDNDFTDHGNGLHCSNCDKVLTDFRGKSTEEVSKIIRSSTKEVCGVWDPHQYDYKVSNISLPKNVQRFGLSLLGILGFLGPVLTSCSDEAPKPNPVDTKHQNAFNKLKFPMKLEGILKDEKTGDGLGFARISIFQNGRIIRTEEADVLGNFRFVLNENDLIRENFDFIMSAEQYDQDTLKNFSVEKSKFHGEKINLTLKAQPVIPSLGKAEMPDETIAYTTFTTISGSVSQGPLKPHVPEITLPAIVPQPMITSMIESSSESSDQLKPRKKWRKKKNSKRGRTYGVPAYL